MGTPISSYLACKASVSMWISWESWDRRKKEEWSGRGRGKKETLACKPHDSEKLWVQSFCIIKLGFNIKL